MRHNTAARKGSKPRPTMTAPQMATGVPPPAAPSRNAPKAKPMRIAWMRAAADNRELAGLDRDVVEQHRVKDRPADRQQAEQGAMHECHARHAERHAKDE